MRGDGRISLVGLVDTLKGIKRKCQLWEDLSKEEWVRRATAYESGSSQDTNVSDDKDSASEYSALDDSHDEEGSALSEHEDDS
jgi:hypothetical protein